MNHKTKNLHSLLDCFPPVWQRAVITKVMGHYFCDDSDYVELFRAWSKIEGADGQAAFDALGLDVWQPFENFGELELYEMVETDIYAMVDFLKEISAQETIEALKDAYPYVKDDALRLKIGTIIASSFG